MEKIENLLIDYVESIETCNTNLVRKIWDREGTISLFCPQFIEYDFENIKNKYYITFLHNNFSKRIFKIKNIMTKYYGNTAFLEYEYDFFALSSKEDKEIHIQGKETLFIVKRDDGWKISNIHNS